MVFTLVDEMGDDDVKNEIGEGAAKKADGWDGYDSGSIGPFCDPIAEVASGGVADDEGDEDLEHAKKGDAGAVDPSSP
jgi:hypothetical protein